MRVRATLGNLVLALALAAAGRAQAGGETNPPPLTTSGAPRDCYNAGAKLLAARKYADAEKMFQAALAGQDDRVQPPALYNLGHARFYDGLDRLKQGPDAQKAAARGDSALATGAAAIHRAESALAQNDLNAMIEAYLAGRGARRNLRDAEKAVAAALDHYGKTLDLWLRADNDFKGAAELNPSETNAAYNAKIVERGIAKLVDSVSQMQQMMGAMAGQRQELGRLLGKLKGQIPAPNAPPGGAGEDNDGDDIKPDSLAGQKEGPSREGEQMQIPLSPDQAGEILNGLSLDGTRRLEMSDQEGKPLKDRKGRNW